MDASVRHMMMHVCVLQVGHVCVLQVGHAHWYHEAQVHHQVTREG